MLFASNVWDAIKFTFDLFDIVAKEEYRYVLGLMTELMSTVLVKEHQTLMKHFKPVIQSSLVEFIIDDQEINITNFGQAMEETSIDTDIIGADNGDYYIKKGLSIFSPKVPYCVLTNRFEYDTKIADLRKQSSISMTFLNRLRISIANVKAKKEEEFTKLLFQAILARVQTGTNAATGSNIKILRSVDPKTFKPPGDFIASKSCQKKYQPIYVDPKDLDSFTEEDKKRVTKLRNNTTGGDIDYFCPTHNFPYLNFVSGHPDGLCVPCCQVKPPSEDELASCKTTGRMPEVKHKVKKSSSYSYLPTAGNHVERGRVYNIPGFTDIFDLNGIALARKVGNFTIPALDAMTIFMKKSPEEIVSDNNDSLPSVEIPKPLVDAFTPGSIADLAVPLGQHVDTLWVRHGITPIYIYSSGDSLSIRTIPSESTKYIVIFKTAPNKTKGSLTSKAEAKLKAKIESAGGAVGENYFMAIRGSPQGFTSQEDCIFGPEDDIIRYIFTGKIKSNTFGLLSVEPLGLEAQVVDHQDKVIGVILESGEFLSVVKSFPNNRLPKIEAGKEAPDGLIPPFVTHRRLVGILDNLGFAHSPVVYKDEVIALKVNDMDIFCSKGPKSKSGSIQVHYDIRSFYESVLWNKTKVDLMAVESSIGDRAKSALYKKYMYSIVLLQVAERFPNGLESTESLSETRAIIDSVVTFTKKETNFAVSNMLEQCSDDLAEYCKEGKVIIDASYKDELVRIIHHDINNNYVIKYIHDNINNFKIINRYRFTRRFNEKITFYEVE
jgi:hypothetical protein